MEDVALVQDASDAPAHMLAASDQSPSESARRRLAPLARTERVCVAAQAVAAGGAAVRALSDGEAPLERQAA